VVSGLGLPAETAWLKITAASPITGFELFGTSAGNQLAGYTGVGISSTGGVFAKVEDDGWTGIAFVNIEDSAASVTLNAHMDDGSVVATEVMTVNPNAEVVDLAENIFTQDISAATCISYSSDREVVGFQLNGSSGGMMLDGLPAMAGATGRIYGSISGTTVIAVVDGEIVASDNTAERAADLDRDGNGIYESFSFTLLGIPVDKNVIVYLIRDGEILSLYFDSDGDATPDTNTFSLTSKAAVYLGFVDTDFEGQDGRAIPENNPTDNSNVNAEAEDTEIAASLNYPDTSGLSLSQLTSEGLEALQDGWGLRAKSYFEAAENLAGSSTSNDADTARFFYALTRVAALGFDTYSDGILSNGLNTLGDILDGFGTPSEDTKRSNLEAFAFPDPLPNNSPTGSDLQDFLKDVVLPELEAAIDNLYAVSQSFNKQWLEPFDHEMVESDYGDVLFFRAAFKGALASIFTESAYALNADIDATVNIDKTIEQFLNDEPNFLTLAASPSSDLSDAENNLDNGLDDLDAAIVWMDQIELDAQGDDFINLGDSTPDEINQARADIIDAKNSLNGPTSVNDNEDPSDAFMLNMSVFFAGMDFRDPNLLPPFLGNEASGFFPDPTFNGMFGAGIDLNEDVDPVDGIPDILQ
jgi:hypothetical protein